MKYVLVVMISSIICACDSSTNIDVIFKAELTSRVPEVEYKHQQGKGAPLFIRTNFRGSLEEGVVMIDVKLENKGEHHIQVKQGVDVELNEAVLFPGETKILTFDVAGIQSRTLPKELVILSDLSTVIMTISARYLRETDEKIQVELVKYSGNPL